MAGPVSSSNGASQLPKYNHAPTAVKSSSKLSRRQLTLIGITICLNVLLWSSIFVATTTLYLIRASPDDKSSIPSYVMSLSSAFASLSYIILHTIFSLKQRTWRHQRRNPSIIQKTSYFAVRLAVSLCVLWLLTSGWNSITVARRPTCLPRSPGLANWEAGTTCTIGRVTIAISFIALIASCALFWMIAVVRRPFEAHVFHHGFREPVNPYPTPAVSRRPSPARNGSYTCEKYRGRVSISTPRSSPSDCSNNDVETLDLNASPSNSTNHIPSPVRSSRHVRFASTHLPPLVPAGFLPRRNKSLENLPPIFQPSTFHNHLIPPRKISALMGPSGLGPSPAPMQYSASAWKAVHPALPSPLRSAVTRSSPHLRQAAKGHKVLYRPHRSRSSVSLTRPYRINTLTPAVNAGYSSRSGSTSNREVDQGSPLPRCTHSTQRATSNEIAFALMNNMPIPGTTTPNKSHHPRHSRHASAPDSTTGGADRPSTRMAKGWKPILQDQDGPRSPGAASRPRLPIRHVPLPSSSSSDLLTRLSVGADNIMQQLAPASRLSPHSSPEDNAISFRREFDRELDKIMGLGGRARQGPRVGDMVRDGTVRRSRSDNELIRGSEDSAEAYGNMMRAATVSRMPRHPVIVKRTVGDDERWTVRAVREERIQRPMR